MAQRKYTTTELGTVYGMLAGAVAALIAFSFTGDPVWFAFLGAGLALGLGIGAILEKRKH